VKPLADVPAFANILLLFSNPILGVLTGMLITAIIQSSSASVGILQALSATGKITYASAVPIVLGQNIGTCVTALLSSIGTNKNARRAALVHLYFNVIGTTVFLCLFYGLDAIFHFSFIANRASAVGIAVIHTVFNLSATALLLPFCNGLEKLAYLTIRDDPTDTRETFPLLDERLLVTPTVAISQCKALTNEMANLSKDALLRSIELIENFSEEKAVVIMNMEDVIDRFEDQLGSYLVKISSKSLSAADGREVSKLLHSISDLERIGDHAVNIEKTAREIHEKKVAFSEQAKEEIVTISGAVREILELATESFIKEDVAVAKMVEPLEQVVDLLRSKLKRRHIHRLQEGSCTIEMGFIFLDLLTNFERVADHCSNIAVCIIEMEHGTLDTHEYLKEVKRISDDEYSTLFENFKQKYAIS